LLDGFIVNGLIVFEHPADFQFLYTPFSNDRLSFRLVMPSHQTIPILGQLQQELLHQPISLHIISQYKILLSKFFEAPTAVEIKSPLIFFPDSEP
jgi:hypothetical protein